MSDEFVDIGEHGEKDLLNVYFAGKRSVVGFNITRLFSQSDIQAVKHFLLNFIEENRILFRSKWNTNYDIKTRSN